MMTVYKTTPWLLKEVQTFLSSVDDEKIQIGKHAASKFINNSLSRHHRSYAQPRYDVQSDVGGKWLPCECGGLAEMHAEFNACISS